MTKSRGLALIIVIGVLGVLAVLAVAFVAMAQLERRASEQRVNAARAYLLARSGIEDALARLELGQNPAYQGEDWDADGILSGYEAAQEVHRRGILDTDCPVRHAMRPSFFARVSAGSPDAALLEVDRRKRGYSGVLAGDHAALGNSYALKVQSSNAGIHVNGGALDARDRDPDGPGAGPEDFPLNPDAAAEVAPLLPNGKPDHMDTSMEGPNGFLVRLLNNLDAVVTNGASAQLGEEIVGNRPVGGYTSLDELKLILGQARYDQFRSYLTLHAWVDPKVVKPQPMDGRPQRWEDIDDAHRIGAEALEISGVHEDPATVSFTRRVPLTSTDPATLLSLDPGISGHGVEGDPWVQTVTATNYLEGTRSHPVRWERGFVYAWSQLRPAPPAPEPRQPVAVNSASQEVLASVFLGLKGAALEVWDGAAGWDGGFGFFTTALPIIFWNPDSVLQGVYPYPSEATEETPWHRARVDYGMTYGASSPARPWYGPAHYNPHAPSDPFSAGGKPVVQCAPLGRLKETRRISLSQATAIAGAVLRDRPFRTWQKFNAFVEALPRWEDGDEDGFLDGPPYKVVGDGGVYTRRVYQREDLDSDGVMDNETFPDGAKGLTFLQKDVLIAMANPNTDLNDFNPDANLFKEVDKTDLAGISCAPTGYAHTTELALDDGAGYAFVRVIGRVAAVHGRLLARHEAGILLRAGHLRRDTSQADFMGDYRSGRRPLPELLTPTYAFPLPSPAPYPLTGSPLIRQDEGLPLLDLRQALVSYPEPQTAGGGVRAADAAYDGRLGLGFIGPDPGPGPAIETLRGALFDTPHALDTADLAALDLRGPFHHPLLAASDAGNVFPDGVYSEKDRTLKYLLAGNVLEVPETLFYLASWVKPGWLPEASPRPHALACLSPGAPPASGLNGPLNPYGVLSGRAPLDDVVALPVGLYFVPARNNFWQDTVGTYQHGSGSTRGWAWPRRALLWGCTHSLFASDCLNRRGIENPPAAGLLGRLEGRRWQHVAMVGQVTAGVASTSKYTDTGRSRLILGGVLASSDGGGHNWGFGGLDDVAIASLHLDGTPNHIRFGAIAAEHNMNYVADATFACVRAGAGPPTVYLKIAGVAENVVETQFTGSSSPAALGRYYKEDGATFISAKLPAGIRPLRVTWTEIPCDLWFDRTGPEEVPDGWLDSLENDRNGNGKRDAHVEIEVWDDRGMLARFDDPAADNHIPRPQGRLYYKAVFVNEWDPATRANSPLDVTPFLDDVTLTYTDGGGPKVLSWETDE